MKTYLYKNIITFLLLYFFILEIHSNETKKTLILISNPRSLTTAFERSFIERGDFEIIHEPWAVAYWVHKKGISIGENKLRIELSKNKNHEDIKNYINSKKGSKPIFIKDFSITMHDDLIKDEPFLKNPNNIFVFLIRSPDKVLNSLYKLYKKNVVLGSLEHIEELVDYKKLRILYEKITVLKGKEPVVINADDLQNNATSTMKLFCEKVNIDFLPHALKWNPGIQKEWKAGKPWHTAAINSTCFIATDSPSILGNFIDIPEPERTNFKKLHNFFLKDFQYLNKKKLQP